MTGEIALRGVIIGREASKRDDRLTEADALARAVIVYAAIERLAARSPTTRTRYSQLQEADFRRAEADILTILFTRWDR